MSTSKHNRISGYRSLQWTEMAVQGLRGEKKWPCPPLPSSRVSSVSGRHSLAGARSHLPGSGDCVCAAYSQPSPGQAREGLQIRVTGLLHSGRGAWPPSAGDGQSVKPGGSSCSFAHLSTDLFPSLSIYLPPHPSTYSIYPHTHPFSQSPNLTLDPLSIYPPSYLLLGPYCLTFPFIHSFHHSPTCSVTHSFIP